MITIRQALAAFFESKGYTRDFNARTTKYWVYTHKDSENNIYLGSSGACRKGKKATETFDMGEVYIKARVAIGRELLSKPNDMKAFYALPQGPRMGEEVPGIEAKES